MSEYRWIRVESDTNGLRTLTLDKPKVNALGRELVERLNRELSRAIKQAVDVPVMVVGRINDPFLAEDIRHSEDYSEWYIDVPEGITFHNGEALTAQTVADNINARRRHL